MKRHRTSAFVGLLAASTLVFSGCEFLEYFKDPKKGISRRVERMKAAINGDNWTLAHSLMTKDFRWITSDGVTYKPLKRRSGQLIEHGKTQFRESIDKLPRDRIGFFLTVEDVRKITDTRYLALVNSRLKIRRGTADVDNVKWQSNQIWVKVGDQWFLEEIKDLGIKTGNRDVKYYTNPPVPEKKAKKKRTRRKK